MKSKGLSACLVTCLGRHATPHISRRRCGGRIGRRPLGAVWRRRQATKQNLCSESFVVSFGPTKSSFKEGSFKIDVVIYSFISYTIPILSAVQKISSSFLILKILCGFFIYTPHYSKPV
jgi:hypothetical protein